MRIINCREEAFNCLICKDPRNPIACEDCPDCNIDLGMALDYL